MLKPLKIFVSEGEMNDSADIMKDLMSEWHQFLNEASIPIRQKAHIPIPDDLKHIHKIITEKGKKLLLVGGAVRDVLMGKIPKDYDLATDAKPGQVIQILQSREGLRLDLTGRAFGVVRVKTPEGNEYEIATFRRDIGKGRRPAGVEFSDIGTDATRRDLTINALFYDIDSGEILDYVGGIADIKNGIIRAVGNPEERFDEDKLRILRTVRFAGRMGSDLDPETKNAILKDNELVGVAEPRITDEFIKGVESSKNVERFLGLLKELNLFGQIFPGLDIDISGGGSHNYFVQIAALLRNNPIEMIVPVLKKMRYSGAEIKVIKFLLQFYHLSDNTAPRLKKSFNLQRARGVDPEYLKDLAAITGTPPRVDVQRFIQFAAAPPAANPRELIAQGLKYEEIGRAMEQAEIDSYRQLSTSDVEGINEQATIESDIDMSLVEFIVNSNAIEGYHVDPRSVIDALEGLRAGYPLSYVSSNPHITGHLAGLDAVKDMNPNTLDTAISVHSAMGPDVLEAGTPGMIRSGVEAKASGGIQYAPSADIPTAMTWWESQKFSSPFERHTMYELIHPFSDGNGRSGRILLVADMGFDFSAVNKMISDRSKYIDALNDVRENYTGNFWSNSLSETIEPISQMTLSKTKLKKIILHEIKSLMGNQSHKLPDFLYAPLEAAIKNSNFWAKPNTEDESDMESVRGEWHNQTPAATDLGWAIEDYLKSSGIPVKVIVISLEEEDSDIGLPVDPDHRLYPNRIVVAGQQGVGSRGQFNMYLFLTPVSSDFRPGDVNPEEISRRIGNIVRHELIHAKQFEKRRRSQNISRMVAKDRFEAEGEIVPDETREIHLQSKMEIDAYAHEFAEELLQIYGKDKALNILRGKIPLDSLNISDQFKEYLDKIPGEAAVIRLKKKIYSNIIDLVDRGIYTEAKRKNRRSRKHDEKTYRVGNKKNLYLDRPTSHGGWPEGPSNSPLSNKPVNVQISDWLKDMDLLETIALRVLSESMGYFGAGFANFKKLVDSGVDAESAADESGFKEIDRGYTRKVYEHPSSKEFVLKIAHDGSDRPDARTSNERLTLAKRTNRDEARSGRETAYDVFPKVYPGDSEGSWILSERVMTLSGNDEMSEFFPEANIPNARYMWILLLDMGMKYAKELGDIHASGDWQAEPKEFKEQMEKLRTTSPGRDVAETFLNLWKNPTFREVSEAMAKYNIAPVEIRYDNVGFVMRGGKKQFVILDVSVGLNPDEATY